MDVETAIQRLKTEHGASSLKAFTSATDAVQRIIKFEKRERDDIVQAALALAEKRSSPAQVETRVHYPILGIPTQKGVIPPPDASYGWTRADRGRGGLFFRTMARSDFHADYLVEQIDLMLRRYNTEAIVGLSNVPIPLIYATEQEFPEDVGGNFTQVYTDELAHCDVFGKDEYPLSLFTGPEIDYAWTFFQHYTGTSMKHLQRFVIFTNYKMHMSEFRAYAEREMKKRGRNRTYDDFIMPEALHEQENGNGDDTQDPQMPAFHLTRKDGNGISIIRIGVGPSNALNMARKVCTRRPHAVIMLGHCAGIQMNQIRGMFFLVTAYNRFDRILDDYLPLRAGIGPIGELQVSLKDNLAKRLGIEDRSGSGRDEWNRVFQSGNVATTDDREWEKNRDYIAEIDACNSGAVEMESSTVSAACVMSATPHASLLCISDMPLHGKQKLAGSAQEFYRKSKKQHLMAAIGACEDLRADPMQLHSRKLRRPLTQPPFR